MYIIYVITSMPLQFVVWVILVFSAVGTKQLTRLSIYEDSFNITF